MAIEQLYVGGDVYYPATRLTDSYKAKTWDTYAGCETCGNTYLDDWPGYGDLKCPNCGFTLTRDFTADYAKQFRHQWLRKNNANSP